MKLKIYFLIKLCTKLQYKIIWPQQQNRGSENIYIYIYNFTFYILNDILKKCKLIPNSWNRALKEKKNQLHNLTNYSVVMAVGYAFIYYLCLKADIYIRFNFTNL